MKTTFNLQPTLKNEVVVLRPLQINDFESLYHIASDPLIWIQHPNKNRYERKVFQTYFQGAMESGGAFLITDVNHEPIGCTRYYGLNEADSSILIGYTFFGRSWWGGNYNKAAKALMLNHAFEYVEKVIFHIGANNIRSQKAIEKIGALKTGEEEIAYYGEITHLNFVYQIEKNSWQSFPNK